MDSSEEEEEEEEGGEDSRYLLTRASFDSFEREVQFWERRPVLRLKTSFEKEGWI